MMGNMNGGGGCWHAPLVKMGSGFYLDNCFLISFRQVLCLMFCLLPFSHDLQNKKTFKFKIGSFFKYRFNEIDYVFPLFLTLYVIITFQFYLSNI